MGTVGVECPSCKGEVGIPDLDGHYACPLCNVVFEYEVDDDRSLADDEDEFDWMDVAILLFCISFFAFFVVGLLLEKYAAGQVVVVDPKRALAFNGVR